MGSAGDFRTAWQREYARLREVEDRIAHAWEAYASGRGPGPTPLMLEELSAARRDADARLQRVLAELRSAARPRPEGEPDS